MDTGTAIGRRGFLAATGGTAAAVGAVDDGRAAVDAELAERSGRVEGIVRLEPAAVAGSPDGSSRADVVAGLRDHAARTQQRVVDYVEGTPGVEIRRRFWLANAALVAVDTERASFADLAAVEGVERVHRTGAVGSRSASPQFGDADSGGSAVRQVDGDVAYGLEMMNVPAVWDRFDTRGEGARIAVIDTGVDPSHPDIDLDAWAEFDAEGRRVDGDPHDPNGHGTGMSGIATGGDASGTRIGVAPDADLLVARQDPDGVLASSIAGLEWAVENGADAVSMSFEFGPLAHEAIEPFSNAVAAGAVPVASAFGSELFFAPGAFHHTLTAGAVDEELNPYRDGNGGEIRTDRYWRSDAVPDDWPDGYVLPTVVTAGVDVPSAVPDNEEFDGGHRRNDGYSNAPPHVAGVVALLRSLDGDLTPAEIERVLAETAEQPGEPYDRPEPNGAFGRGVVNAAAAAAEVGGRGREVAGTVTDPDGAPVTDATVTAVTGATARTDEQGRYTLSVPAGEASVTASATGYDPVTRRVESGDGRDLAFESRRWPDIRRTSRPPTRVPPGGTVALEFEVEHAESAAVFARESAAPVDPSAVSARVNGEAVEPGQPAELPEDAATIRVEASVDDGVRGTLALTVGVANPDEDSGDTAVAEVELDAVHVHERPLRVTGEEDVRTAVAVAAPGTVVALAGDRWELPPEPVDATVPDSRSRLPIFEESRDDRAGLVVNEPITLAAAEGHDPTVVVPGGDAGSRTFGVQIRSHFVTLAGIEVVAEGATGAVSVLDGDGVRLGDLDLSGATNGVSAQFTKSLVVRGSRIGATETGVSLRDFSVNAAVRDNVVRDAERGVFLSGRVGDELVDVDAALAGNTFENVGTDVDGEGTATIRRGDGTARTVGGESPPDDSALDLLLYGVTGLAVGTLLYPYGRRRFG